VIFSSIRTFQLWDFHVSHSRLLIRSPKSTNDLLNQDIIFYGVTHLDLPATFFGLDIEQLPDGEAGGKFTPTLGSTTFRLMTTGQACFLAAVACKVLENDLDLFDSSLEPPYSVRPRGELGRVLARS